MKTFIYIFIIAAALIFFFLFNLYQDITYIPEKYEENKKSTDQTEFNLQDISKETLKLNEKELASLIEVFSVFYLSSVGMPSDILEAAGVGIEPGSINIEGVVNFKKMDLDKIFSGNLSFSIILLKLINPERLFIAVKGNNRISGGKLYIDGNSTIKVGKKTYKLYNLLENEQREDIFNKGVNLPPMLKMVKNVEYHQNYAELYLE